MRAEKGKHKIGILMQLKFIMINFYSAFFIRDLVFDPKYLEIEIEVKKNDDKVLSMVKRL